MYIMRMSKYCFTCLHSLLFAMFPLSSCWLQEPKIEIYSFVLVSVDVIIVHLYKLCFIFVIDITCNCRATSVYYGVSEHLHRLKRDNLGECLTSFIMDLQQLQLNFLFFKKFLCAIWHCTCTCTCTMYITQYCVHCMFSPPLKSNS